VVGHPGYEVSDLGNVRSLSRAVPCSYLGRPTKGRAFPGVNLRPTLANGYLQVRIGGRKRRKIYHLVLEAFVGPRPDGTEAMHLDGDRSNNALTNLRWGTHSENVKQIVFDGRRKLSVDQVCAVRAFAGGVMECARALDVPWWTVSNIRRGKQYAHVGSSGAEVVT
jgi:hypothetical protein